MATPSRSASGSSSSPGAAANSSGSDSPYSFRIWYRIIPARSLAAHTEAATTALPPSRAPHDSAIGARATTTTATDSILPGPLAWGRFAAREYSQRWSEEDEAQV
nr:unnamed protein product [Digitaria exilis]